MELKTKKIIAREFLIFTVVLLISCICFVGIFIFDFYQQFKIDAIQKEIEFNVTLADSLSFDYNLKMKNQKDFFIEYSDAYNYLTPDQKSIDTYWKKFSNSYRSDSIILVYNKLPKSQFLEFLNSKGFHSGKLFETFVADNLISSNDSLNFWKSNIINDKINGMSNLSRILKGKIINRNEQISYSLIVFTILFSIGFPIRYIYYGILWSLNIIKLTDESK